jgi:hypothetical protein
VLVGLYPKVELASTGDPEAPRSGLRAPSSLPTPPKNQDEEPAPDTARSASLISYQQQPEPRSERAPVSVPISAPAPVSFVPVETEEMRTYRETFARGTAAFIQNRFQDAVDAFQACLHLRPDDHGAAVMLRRALRDLGSY